MMTYLKILLICIVFVEIRQVSSNANTSLVCESPCVSNQTCEVSCTVVAGQVVTGLVFFWNGNDLVTCVNQQCTENFPAFHNYTQTNPSHASLQILNFNNATNGGLYECADGSGGRNGKQIYEMNNAEIPDGNLSFSAGSVIPGNVTCTLARVGTASLTLKYSNGTVLATNASTIVSVEAGTVDQITCSVEWPECPNYINRKFPSITLVRPTCNCTCICHCPCHCPTVFGLLITLAVVTAALLVCIIVIRCCQGGKWELGNGDRKLTMKEWVTIILMVVTVAFIIAVGVYTLSSERKCDGMECCGKPCCAHACCAHACCPNTCCPDAYKASIAFVVIGSAVVITAIIVLVLTLCCFSKRSPVPLQATTGGAGGDMNNPTKPSVPLSNLSNNGNPNTPSKPSPGRRLSPLSPTEKTGNVTETQPGPEKKKKKKKSKKDQPELTEERPLPTPKQDDKASKTQRRTSMDASVNMSGSNNSPLPIRSNFTPGNQASGPSEGVMPPVGSSSLKR